MEVERTRWVKLRTVKQGTPYTLPKMKRDKIKNWRQPRTENCIKNGPIHKQQSTIKHDLNQACLNPQIIKLKQYARTGQLDELGQ